MDLLRFITAGSVDDGKSTLIGRLLYDTRQLFDDTIAGMQRASEAQGLEDLNLALLTDGLRAEREQGITIDVAYRYFATDRRKFIIADCPGHVQYTRNMVTGASTADLALILVDARNGVIQQTRRHTVITNLLGIKDVVACVNKMDLVNWSKEQFDSIEADFRAFAGKLGIPRVTVIPIAAATGENIVDRSPAMDWYQGPTVLEFLEDVPIPDSALHTSLRFPVQYVLRPQRDDFHDYRAYAGTVAAGELVAGSSVLVLPAGLITTVQEVDVFTNAVPEAAAGTPVAVRIADNIDVSRGHMLADPTFPPVVANRFRADVCWMNEERPLRSGQKLVLKHTTRRIRCVVESLDDRLDIEDLVRSESPETLSLNEIGRVTIQVLEPIFADPYDVNRDTGSFILIDSATYRTVAAGMIRELDSREVADGAVV